MSRIAVEHKRRFVLKLTKQEYDELVEASEQYDSMSQFLRMAIKRELAEKKATADGTQGGGLLQLRSVAPALGIADNERYR